MIPTFLLSLATKLLGEKLAEKFAKPLAGAAMVVAACLLLWLIVAMIRGDAQDDLRSDMKDDQIEQHKLENAAGNVTRDELNKGNARDRAKIEDIDNATAKLPDARPSDRQLRRACAELSFTPPACAGLRPR